jgi:hypothetical protein
LELLKALGRLHGSTSHRGMAKTTLVDGRYGAKPSRQS